MKKSLLFSLTLLVSSVTAIAQIPCCQVLWLKADKYVITDSTGKVSIWKDASGNGNNVKQTDAASQPTLHENVFGGRPAIFFDGVHGKYSLSNTMVNRTASGSPRTIFIVGKMDSAAVANGGGASPSAGGALLTFRRTTPVFSVEVAYVPNVAPYNYVYTAGLGTNSNGTVSNKFINLSKRLPFINTYISGGANTNLQVRQNDKYVTVSQPNTTVSETGVQGFTVGDREDFSGQDWQGYIAEIIVYDRQLSLEEIEQTEEYLARKYSLRFPETEAIAAVHIEDSKVADAAVKMYPNPVKDKLIVTLPKEAKNLSAIITNSQGRIVKELRLNNSNNVSIPVSALTNGVYMLTVQYDDKTYHSTFIKN